MLRCNVRRSLVRLRYKPQQAGIFSAMLVTGSLAQPRPTVSRTSLQPASRKTDGIEKKIEPLPFRGPTRARTDKATCRRKGPDTKLVITLRRSIHGTNSLSMPNHRPYRARIFSYKYWGPTRDLCSPILQDIPSTEVRVRASEQLTCSQQGPL